MKTYTGEKVLNIVVLTLILGVVITKYSFLWPVALFLMLAILPNKVRFK